MSDCKSLRAMLEQQERDLLALDPNDGRHAMAAVGLGHLAGMLWAECRDERAWQRASRTLLGWAEQVPPPDWRAPLYLLGLGALWYRRASATLDDGEGDHACRLLETARDSAGPTSGVRGTAAALMADLRMHRFLRDGSPVDLEAAIREGTAAMAIERAKQRDHYLAARALSLAFVHRFHGTGQHTALDAAVDAAEHMLELAADDDDRSEAYTALGIALRARFHHHGRREDLDAEVAAYTRALDLTDPSRVEVLAPRLDNLGNAYASRYTMTKDPEDLRASIEYSRRAHLSAAADAPERARIHANLAISITDLAVHDRQPQALEEALSLIREGMRLPTGDVDVQTRLLAALGRTGLIAHALPGSPRQGDAAILDEAIDATERAYALALHDETSRPVPYRLGNRGQMAAVSRRLSGALLLRARQHDGTPRAAADRMRALSIAETAKSPLLTHELTRLTVRPAGRVDPEVLQQERQLLARLAELDVQDLTSTDESGYERRLLGNVERQQLQQQLNDLWDDVAGYGPESAAYVDQRRSPASLLTGRLALSTGVLLSLVPTEAVDASTGDFSIGLACLAVTDGGDATVVFEMSQDPVPAASEAFVAQVPATRGRVGSPDDWWQGLAHHLAGGKAYVGDLVVVSPTPAGASLAWGLLLEKAGWLGTDQRTAVVVVPSLAVVVLPEPPEDELSRPRVGAGHPVVVGNPQDDLDAAADEATQIAELLGVAPLVGRDATVEAVLQGIRGSTLVHLASHAEYDAENPFDSAVHLADGSLSVGRLIGEWSGASLVVLSACEGAAGGFTTGGEALGLSAALLRTGVDSVVASLWRVDDAASAYLMTLFHQHLASGAAPGAALRAAQLQARSEPGWEDPYYWAGFLVGDRSCASPART